MDILRLVQTGKRSIFIFDQFWNLPLIPHSRQIISWLFNLCVTDYNWCCLQAALARALNGVGLAIVAPAILSLVADFTRDESRGVAFGWLYGAGQIGSVAAGAFVTLMGSHTVMGIGGWRAVFICMSLSSILMGLAIFTLGHDPRANQEYSQIG